MNLSEEDVSHVRACVSLSVCDGGWCDGFLFVFRPLVTLDSVVVHTFRRPPTRKGVVDAFADMFMLSFSNVLFATNWSLFGRTAAEIGRSKDVYYIDDTSCGSGSHRDCFGTGLPDVCTLAHDEL